MLTIFAIPKPFRGHIGLIQQNAIHSWILLQPKPEVILMGDDEGTATVAKQSGLRHEPNVERNEYGTPLVSDLFSKARALASHPIMCYINADIIVTGDFMCAVRQIQSENGDQPFLMGGQRWNLDITSGLNFSRGWEQNLRDQVNERGVLEKPDGIDYFVFRKETFSEIPPFAIGRPMWDNWFLYHARFLKIPVIDATAVVFIVHQNHDYSHVPKATGKRWEGPEADLNRKLAGGLERAFDLTDATHKLTPKGIVRARTDLRRKLRRFTALHPNCSLTNRLIRYLLYRFSTT